MSTTDANGIATTVLTPGSDSVVQRVTATLANASGSPQTFNAPYRCTIHASMTGSVTVVP